MRLRVLALVTLAALQLVPAIPSADPQMNDDAMDTILVTAQKREQSLVLFWLMNSSGRAGSTQKGIE